MLLITTATGKTGSSVLAEAMRNRARVRVLVRDPAKLTAAVRSYCDVLTGDMRDEATLAKAASGVEGVFFCVPQQPLKTTNVAAYYRSFCEPAARVFAQTDVKRIVTISAGRGNPSDLGPSGSLAIMEQGFDHTKASTRHVRCGYFMENLSQVVLQLKFKGSFSLPIANDYPIAVEAAEDIGKTAARWLLDATWIGNEGVTVPFGQILTCEEMAVELSQALGKKIVFAPLPSAEFKKALMKYGIGEPVAQSFVELFDGIDHETMSGLNKRKQSGGIALRLWAVEHLRPQMRLMAVLKRILG